MTKAKELIDWFWSEYEIAQESLIPLYPESHGLCQCSTENLIRVSADPDRMRAFFMIGVTIDQMMYTHYCVSGDHPSRVVRRKSLAEREKFNKENDPNAPHRYKIYRKYLDSHFKFPELFAHGGIGMASPSWLTYPAGPSWLPYPSEENSGLNWDIVQKVSETLFNDLYRWFDAIEEQSEKHRFQIYLKLEVIREFGPSTRKEFLPIIENLG